MTWMTHIIAKCHVLETSFSFKTHVGEEAQASVKGQGKNANSSL